jgi:hypothetical protein
MGSLEAAPVRAKDSELAGHSAKVDQLLGRIGVRFANQVEFLPATELPAFLQHALWCTDSLSKAEINLCDQKA